MINYSNIAVSDETASNISSKDLNILIDSLKEVIDPELGLNIVDLGLVYSIIKKENNIVIEMSLTTPGCPVSETLPTEAEQVAQKALRHLNTNLEVQVVWDPPWSIDKISPQAMKLLGYG